MGLNGSFDISSAVVGAAFDRAKAFHEARVVRAMMRTTDRGAKMLEQDLRNSMKAAGLGNLGNALKASSDLEKGRGVHSLGGNDFSVSGIVYVRSGSARTRGALTAYTAGANIKPLRGPYLWFPTEDVQRFVGSRKDRQRLSPGNWESSGMEAKLGPLIPLKSVNGQPLLAVERVGTSLAGARRSAKSLTKRGRARKGQRIREILIVFVAIRNTSRTARVSPQERRAQVMRRLPSIFAQELRRA